ncbi:hypothetical protein [Dyadobacter frigoris]|uniref:hypothetical protein n=1 Tax=Dyadobacter frigoris TaxID=2576211 RepID=UPI001484E9CC|nr:hypothetical protein [Dyadobacter frigoris]GLU55614.1 hypothetical protein Dfri01_50750 [Dyadobacter frigoris]
MKKVDNETMANLQGGVSGRTCMYLGWATIGFAFAGQFGWSFGTAAGALAAGCFDK